MVSWGSRRLHGVRGRVLRRVWSHRHSRLGLDSHGLVALIWSCWVVGWHCWLLGIGRVNHRCGGSGGHHSYRQGKGTWLVLVVPKQKNQTTPRPPTWQEGRQLLNAQNIFQNISLQLHILKQLKCLFLTFRYCNFRAEYFHLL